MGVDTQVTDPVRLLRRALVDFHRRRGAERRALAPHARDADTTAVPAAEL